MVVWLLLLLFICLFWQHQRGRSLQAGKRYGPSQSLPSCFSLSSSSSLTDHWFQGYSGSIYWRLCVHQKAEKEVDVFSSKVGWCAFTDNVEHGRLLSVNGTSPLFDTHRREGAVRHKTSNHKRKEHQCNMLNVLRSCVGAASLSLLAALPSLRQETQMELGSQVVNTT